MAKNRIVYICTIILLAVFVYLYENSVTYLALYTALLLPVFSLIVTLFSKRRFIISESLSDDSIIKGNDVKYRFMVTNKSFFPYSGVRAFFYANHNAIITDMDKQLFSVPPFGKREIEYELSCRFRGVFEVGLSKIILYDMLGLFKFKQKLKPAQTLTVLPKTVEISRLPLVTFEMETAQINRNTNTEDYSVISGLREYRPSDGIKKVHWKMTAKKNELIVKNYQITSKNAAALVLDNSKMSIPIEEALAKEDRMMQAFVSVMAYCSKAQYPLKLFYTKNGSSEDSEVWNAENLSFHELYAEAVKILFDAEADSSEVLKDISAKTSDFLNIIIFVQKLTSEIYEQIMTLKLFGHNITLLNFSSEAEKEEEAELGLGLLGELMNGGIVCYTLPDEISIDEII